MTPKAKYYETLANTMIKNFEKRRMVANHREGGIVRRQCFTPG
jgi:hypothetical protein